MLERPAAPRLKVAFFLFSRHGETAWNAEGRWQGKTDIPLNATGRSQAEGNGRRLKALLAAEDIAPHDLAIVSSPLCRAFETAEILARHIGRGSESIIRDERLAELTFGAWEGLTLAEVEERFTEGYRQRLAASWHFRGHGGESYNCLKERILPVLTALEGPALIVAHGGVLRVLYHLFGGVAENDAHFQPIRQDRLFRVSPQGLSEF